MSNSFCNQSAFKQARSFRWMRYEFVSRVNVATEDEGPKQVRWEIEEEEGGEIAGKVIENDSFSVNGGCTQTECSWWPIVVRNKALEAARSPERMTSNFRNASNDAYKMIIFLFSRTR